MSNGTQNYVPIPNNSQEIVDYLKTEGIVARLKVILNNIVTNTDQGGVRLYIDEKGALKLGETTLIEDTTAKNVDEQLEKLKQDIGKLDEAIQSLRLVDTRFNQSLSTISESLRQLQEELDELELSGSGVGKYYPTDAITEEEIQGAIFGDFDTNKALSPNSFAFGEKVTAGCRCYYYGDNVVFTDTNATITLQQVQERLSNVPESFETGWQVGDVISMVNNSKYWNCATIESINGNIITVSKLPFTSIADMSGDMGHDDYAIFVFARPESGTGSVSNTAFAQGVDVKGLGYASFTSGRQNENQAQYGFVSGRRNKLTGHAGFVTGQGNTVTGDSAGTFGGNNTVSGAKGLAMGNGNTLTSHNSFIGGHNNKLYSYDSIVSGYGNTVSSPRSFVIGTSNTVTSSTGGNLIGGASNIVENGNYNLLTGNSNEIRNGNSNTCEGSDCNVEGANRCHVEGMGNTSFADDTHIQGRFAKRDYDGRYAHILGNGTGYNNYSNAHTIDWEGNAWYAGKLYIGGTDQDDGKEVATLDKVEIVPTTIGAEGDMTVEEFVSLVASNNHNLKKITLLEDIVIQFDETLHLHFDIDLGGHTLTLVGTNEVHNDVQFYPSTIKNGVIQFNTVPIASMFGMNLKDLVLLGETSISIGDSYLDTVTNDTYVETSSFNKMYRCNFSVLYVQNPLEISYSTVSTFVVRYPLISAINNQISLLDCDEKDSLDLSDNELVFIGNKVDNYQGSNAEIVQSAEFIQRKELISLKDLLYTTKPFTQSFAALTATPDDWSIVGEGYTFGDKGIIPGHTGTYGDTKVLKNDMFITGDEEYTFTIQMSHFSGTQHIHWGASSLEDAAVRSTNASGYTFTAKPSGDYKSGIYSLYKDGVQIASFTDKNTSYGYQNIRTYKFTISSTGIVVNGPFSLEDGATKIFVPDEAVIKEGYVGAVLTCNNVDSVIPKLATLGIQYNTQERLDSIEARLAAIEAKL